MAARIDGGAIVAGSYAGGWVIGEITASGQLNPRFARGGWSVLPFEGTVTNVLQETSGRIILGGNEHASGCCTVNWAAALSADGQLDPMFGEHGRVKLPTGESSGINRLALEPNGDILAQSGYGNMGCWGTALAMLTPSGAPEPLFAERLRRFWDGYHFGAFVGDTYLDGEGFTLVGAGQKPCFESPRDPKPPTTGVIAHFQTNGNPAGPTAQFPSPMYGTVKAFRDGGDTLIVAFPYSDETGQVTVTARHADGSLDPRFGILGRAQIHIPLRSGELSLEALEFIKAAPGELTLVVTPSEDAEVQLIRLRL